MAQSETTGGSTKPKYIKVLRELSSLAALAAIVLAARASIADHYVVPTGSMKPTVQVDDRVVVNKLAFGLRVPFTNTYLFSFSDPQPGQVVVLDSPTEEVVLLKRVVAGPGDLVEVREGVVRLNGQPARIHRHNNSLREDLLGIDHQVSLDYGGGPDFGPLLLPPDQYLVMGDNRGKSLDGRSFGLVSRAAILGRAVAIYFSDSALKWENL